MIFNHNFLKKMRPGAVSSFCLPMLSQHHHISQPGLPDVQMWSKCKSCHLKMVNMYDVF
jgi:hypothetical protein